MKIRLGIDNGPTGSLGILLPDSKAIWIPMPIRKTLKYTKKKAFYSRVNFGALDAILHNEIARRDLPAIALMERPMVNPARFQATLSACQCLEATLIALEQNNIPYQFIDSKEWQKELLPSGLKGEELKQASLQVGKRLWPTIPFKKDADSLLLARYAQLKNL